MYYYYYQLIVVVMWRQVEHFHSRGGGRGGRQRTKLANTSMCATPRGPLSADRASTTPYLLTAGAPATAKGGTPYRVRKAVLTTTQ